MPETGLTVRCEWGSQGLESLRQDTDVFVIIDILSFTTCVDVAVSRGAWVYPFFWNDARSVEFAVRIGAILAGSSRVPGFSLSPASLVDIPSGTRLVLPSPNGSTLSLLAGSRPTLAGSLRNARAVARAAAALGSRISVIAGGERWKADNSLRPALEDWLGAGAVISHLDGQLSPEADLARGAFERARPRLDWYLRETYSGRELIDRGRAEDLRLAGMLDVSACVPILLDQAYQPFLA